MVRKAFRLSVTLMIICAITSLGLSLTFMITKPRIDEQAERKKNNAIFSVLAGAESYRECRDAGGKTYYEVSGSGEILGYALPVDAKGYSSTIRIMVGIGREGGITGINVIGHEETPGLGSRIVEIKPGENEPWFTRQFRGRSPVELTPEKIEAIAGATISSRAVVDGVRKAVEEFEPVSR
jgi:electron transport complex protein RnfG